MKPIFKSLLSKRPDPLRVLETTAFVVESAQNVHIDPDAIKRTAIRLAQEQVRAPDWNHEFHFFEDTERTVDYLFWLDTLNFSFWGQPRWSVEYHGQRLNGYWALAAALKRAIEAQGNVASAESLAHLSPADLEKILAGSGRIPLFADRWRNSRELGTVLCNHWQGHATQLVEAAQGDAPRLAQMIADNFSSFNDVAIYAGREVRLFKRAQILVADLWGSFDGRRWGALRNIEHLTAFADYKLPQLLRAWRVLRYAPTLSKRVDRKIQLTPASPDEVEIRSATLWAVELLRRELDARGLRLSSLQMDWILWQASQGRRPGMRPYHRVRTIFY